jgi:hypothetical protein
MSPWDDSISLLVGKWMNFVLNDAWVRKVFCESCQQVEMNWRVKQRTINIKNLHRKLSDHTILVSNNKSFYNQKVCRLIPELCEGTLLHIDDNHDLQQSSNQSSNNPSSATSSLNNDDNNNKNTQQPSSFRTRHPKPTSRRRRRRPTASPSPSRDEIPITLEPSFSSKSPTFRVSGIQPSMSPSYPRNSRSCPDWKESSGGGTSERFVQWTILEFTYTVQISSLVATFLPEMEDLILQVAADQSLNCQSTIGDSSSGSILRLSYPDPASTLSVCSPSVPKAQTCWVVTSSIRIYYDENNQSRDVAQRQVWNAIREEFDFGNRIVVIIPNQVQIELWESIHTIDDRADPSRLSIGALMGIVILLWTVVWVAGATVKVQLWRSANTRRLKRRKDRSFRRIQSHHHYFSTSNLHFGSSKNRLFGNSSSKCSRKQHPTRRRNDNQHDEGKMDDWMMSDDDDDDDDYDGFDHDDDDDYDGFDHDDDDDYDGFDHDDDDDDDDNLNQNHKEILDGTGKLLEQSNTVIETYHA